MPTAKYIAVGIFNLHQDAVRKKPVGKKHFKP
jgi:hypothetical protein